MQRPNFSALIQNVGKWLAAVVALSMMQVLRPGAGDGALHAMHASADAECRQVARSSSGAERDGAATTTMVNTLPDSTCNHLIASGEAFEEAMWWQMGYDTLKKYVESCPDHKGIALAFYPMTQCANHLGIGGEYFEWLKSVLYLNTTNPGYFCSVVEEMAGELPHPSNLPRGTGYNYPLSIDQWLLLNTNCDSVGIAQLYWNTRDAQYRDWENAGESYPLDTTLIPLSTWGLDTLFAKHFLFHNADVKRGPDILTSIGVNPHPTTYGTLLSFGMAQAAYVKIELYDLLGNAVRAASFEQYLGTGNHSVPLDMSALPSGTYYARIVTAYGEPRTVKIVKS